MRALPSGPTTDAPILGSYSNTQLGSTYAALTTTVTILAAFLFIVTSVVSAAYELAMFSTGGSVDPSVRVKRVWGVILGALSLVMIFSGCIDAVKRLVAVGTKPFVFHVLLLMVCLLKALKSESRR